MSGRIDFPIPRFSLRMPFLAALAWLLFIPVNEARAGFLLQSARHLTYQYISTANDILVEDVTGDGIPDIILAHNDFEEDPPISPLVATYPGLGDGMVGEPVITVSTMGGGDTSDAALVHLNGDAHHDLLLSVEFNYPSGYAVLALLGNGDGTFTINDTLELGHESLHLVAADFTGDGHIDFGVIENNTSGPFFVHWYRGNGDGTFIENGSSTMLRKSDGIIAADIDNDGDMDVAVTSWYDANVMLMRNDGTGQFAMIEYEAPTGQLYGIDAGDVNNDGCDDLVVADSFTGVVGIFFGNTDGTLSPYVAHDTGRSVYSIRLGDLDNDGDPDLTANTAAEWPDWLDRVGVLLNDGSGSFSGPEYFFRYGISITLHDMDGDGALDALMNGPNGDATSILLGRGDGTFICMTDLVFDEYIPELSCTDVDLDGDLDLVLANSEYPDEAVQVLLNNGNGSFGAPASYDVGDEPYRIDLGDLTGDGYPDITVTSYEQNIILILVNAGDGTFQDHQSIPGGGYPTELLSGDLDNDGDLDLAFCDQGQMGVLINPGNGIFSGATFYEAVQYPSDLRLGDVDGDGDLDAAITHRGGFSDGGVYLLINNGLGVFSDLQLAHAIDYPSSLVMADFDGDSDLDIVVGKDNTDDTRYLINDGSGNYTESPNGDLDVGNVEYLKVGDMSGDGLIDLVAQTAIDMTYLPGLGDGTFGPAEAYPLGSNSQTRFDMADLDGNGSLDVAVGGWRYASVTILFNSWSSTGLMAAGPGPGELNPATVRIFPAAGSGGYIAQWSAYGVDRWGVNVALGELDGSAGPEVLTGAGPGPIFGPHVRGFQHDGTSLPGVSFLAYGTNKWGVNVAAGDLDGDGYDEIITGAGPGAVFGPHVRGWSWDGSTMPQPIPGISYFAYGTPKWGVNVSCGDIDGDGYDEIVTGAGPGAVYGPHVRGWNCDGGGATAIPQVSFLAYGTNKWGVNICCGDIDGDGIDEIVTGAGPGAVFGPHVRAWNWDGTGTTESIPAVSYFAYGYTEWGVNVSCGDLDDDGIDEIITGPGPGEGHEARVRGWNYDGQALTAMSGANFLAYSAGSVTSGVKVAGQRK